MATTKFASPIVVAEVLLEAEECNTCGVIYALTREFIAARKKDAKIWYCPNGHQWHYGEGEADRQRKRAEEAERRLAAEQGWSHRLTEDLDTERKHHATTKGQLTKTRNRIHAGVCPECNRHFMNVEMHMETQHADIPARESR